MSLNRDSDDPYELLGLSRGATVNEAAARARKLLNEYYDDHDARTAINEAFETIKEQPGPVEVNGTMVVPLTVSTLSDDVVVNEEVTVRVTNHIGDPVSGAELQRTDDGKRLGKTGDDGQATIEFIDSGMHTIVASKQSHPEPDHQYKDGEIVLHVNDKSKEQGRQKGNVANQTEQEETQSDVGRLRPTFGGDPKAEDPYAVLRLSREATDDEAKAHAQELLNEYSEDPEAQTAINDAFEAVKEQPSPININGTIVVPLIVYATPGKVNLAQEVTVQVTNHIGDPVSGAELKRKDDVKRVGKTDSDGQATVEFFDSGMHTIVASKQSHPEPNHQYKDDDIAVYVKEQDQ